jgi:hypothetical protein
MTENQVVVHKGRHLAQAVRLLREGADTEKLCPDYCGVILPGVPPCLHCWTCRVRSFLASL